MFCHILGAVIEVTFIEVAILKNRFVQGICYNAFFLVIVELRGKNHSGMVVNHGRQVCFNHFPVFPDRKGRTILDICLNQHHTVRFAVTFGRTVSGFLVYFHVFRSKTGLIHMPLQSRPFQYAGSYKTFHFKNKNDLFHRPSGNFAPQLDCCCKDFLIVIRHGILLVADTFCRF